MTDLDPDTKARIEAEERYRAELRAQQESIPQAQPAAPAGPAPKPKKKLGCGAVLGYSLLALIGFGVLGQLLGTGDQASSSAPAALSEPVNTPAAEPAASTPEPTPEPPVQTAGDATVNEDGSYDIGVWRISDVVWNTTNNIGGEYGTDAGSGETFVTVNFSLKNNTNETQSFSSMIDQPQLTLADGAMIDADTMLSIMGEDQMIDGQIAPGLKRAGKYVFRVPTSSLNDMQFQIQFFNGKRLVTKLVE